MKVPPNVNQIIGTIDEVFILMNKPNQLNSAFSAIEKAFGERYTNKIRKLLDSVSHHFDSGMALDDLREIVFLKNLNKGPFIRLSSFLGNPKILANVILYEL